MFLHNYRKGKGEVGLSHYPVTWCVYQLDYVFCTTNLMLSAYFLLSSAKVLVFFHEEQIMCLYMLSIYILR